MSLLESIAIASRQGKVALDPFTYVATFYPLGASATATVSISITSDSDFIIVKSMLTSYSVAGTIIAEPDYLVTLVDTGAGRNLQSAAVHRRNIFGFAERPFVWPEPKRLKGGTTLGVTLTNNTAVAGTVDVAFSGFKLFYYGTITWEELGR